MIVRNAGCGCGGRGSVLRAMGSQGGFSGTCERSPARGREMLQRTAKSCGPDAPTLASSSRMLCRPYRVRRQRWFAGDGGKRARSPGRARRKPLKPLRAGTPGDSGVLVVTRVRSITPIAHEAAGATGIRRSPRPLWARDSCKARAHCVARSRLYAEPTTSLRGAKRRSNPFFLCAARWIASSQGLLAMTWRGCLKIESEIWSAQHVLNVPHKTHPSCPDLVRASINLRNKFLRRRWITR
jgi:hypothetical protein